MSVPAHRRRVPVEVQMVLWIALGFALAVACWLGIFLLPIHVYAKLLIWNAVTLALAVACWLAVVVWGDSFQGPRR